MAYTYIDQETVRKILDAADIVDVVSDFVTLKRSGANYMGLCPFHNERTPSFSVSKAKGVCKCFSCGKGGSAVGFIMEIEQLSYGEALRWLAKKYNIEIKEKELTDEERTALSERESMLTLNDFALNFFEKALTDSEEGQNIGLSYFRQRGLSDAAIKRFRLGYAPEQYDALSREAQSKGYSAELLTMTGLCARSERGRLYDRFRGRVIFPVFTLAGKVVAFGGRTLKTSKDVAKYVNSPESVIYHKSNELYGLYQARRAIVKKDKCILVEGYMDVISMSQRGVENVVASSGTSLTEGQIALIHRFTENVTVIYDSDAAGIKASLRGIDMLLAHGLNVKVMLLPEGDDPDSFSKSHTLEEIEEYMKEHETNFIRFKTRILLNDLADNDPVGRAGLINSIAKSISVIPDRVVRSEFIKECSRLMDTDETIVSLQVAKFAGEAADKNIRDARREQQQQNPATKEPTVSTRPSSRSTTDKAQYLRPSEAEIVRLLVRYGLLPLINEIGEDGVATEMNVAEYVDAAFAEDDMRLENHDLQKVYHTVMAHAEAWKSERQTAETKAEVARSAVLENGREEIRQAAGSIEILQRKEQELADEADAAYTSALADEAEHFLTRNLGADPDETVRSLCTTFISEKYVLSKIHTKASHVETERELLVDRVPRAICGLKIAILQWQEKELRASLPGNDNPGEILAQLQQLRRVIGELARYLGERIVLPR